MSLLLCKLSKQQFRLGPSLILSFSVKSSGQPYDFHYAENVMLPVGQQHGHVLRQWESSTGPHSASTVSQRFSPSLLSERKTSVFFPLRGPTTNSG